MSPHPSSQPDTEERQELGLRLRLRLREGPGSRESRCAAWTRLHRSCSARHLSQRSKVIAIRPPVRQVLFAYLAVPPILEELVVIAVLHHSLLHCVVYNPCHPIPRLGVGKVLVELGVILVLVNEWYLPLI